MDVGFPRMKYIVCYFRIVVNRKLVKLE